MYKFILKYSLLLACVWTLVIFGLCCMPGSYIPTTDWLQLLSFDKFVHASIFFLMTALWLFVLVKNDRVNQRSITLVIVICIGFGGSLEIMQATVFSQRSADWFDFIANSFGCFVALILFLRKKEFLIKLASSNSI